MFRYLHKTTGEVRMASASPGADWVLDVNDPTGANAAKAQGSGGGGSSTVQYDGLGVPFVVSGGRAFLLDGTPYMPVPKTQPQAVNNARGADTANVGGRIMQWNPASGRYDIDVGPVTYAPAAGRSSDPDLGAQQAFTAEENQKTRDAQAAAQQAALSQQQAEMDARLQENRTQAAQADANLAFLQNKFAVETQQQNSRDAQATQAQIWNQQRDLLTLNQSYDQMQIGVAQFNATQQMSVDLENQRRTEANLDRRQSLARDIGTTAQDAGSRGKLAAQLLALQGSGGGLDAGLAGGQDFFTDESLVPLDTLLGQRDEVAKGPNFLSATPIQAPSRPQIAAPFQQTQQGVMQSPGQTYTQLGTAAGSSIGPGTANQAPLPTTVSQMPGYNYTPQEDNPFQDLTYIETPDTSFDDGSSGTGYSVSESDFQALLDSLSPDTPVQNFAKGGMAQGAYMGDEQGPELHIPLGPGEALVIPHAQVKNFLRSATEGKKGKKKQASPAVDMSGMGIGAMADGGLFSEGNIFGTGNLGSDQRSRGFLSDALKRALTGTPYERIGRAPTPVEVSAPGTDPLVQELGGSLQALQSGTPIDLFLRRARLATPQGITAAAGGARRTG